VAGDGVRASRVIFCGASALAVLGLANAGYVRHATTRALAAHPAPGALVDVGGRRLHLLCRGEGAPTVVFEASGFGSHGIYGAAFDDAASRWRACAYDRAGMGYSDPNPGGMDAVTLAGDLERLLQRGEVRPPFVLVGMSAGGLVVRLFAHAHAADTMAMVLVDSMPEDFLDAMPKSRRNAERMLAAAPWLARAGWLWWLDPFKLSRASTGRTELAKALNYRVEPWEAAAGLVQSFPVSIEHVRREGAPAHDLPLFVLAHGVPGDVLGPATDAEEARALEPKWQELQERLARTTRRGQFLRVEGAGHLVPQTHPEAVTNAIATVIRSGAP
jgi:pimeloyl-ACP methyl ester carboxylesterase